MATNLETTLKSLARKLKNARVRVGFMENATYPDGTHVATVAAINNYGAPAAGIPPRPFFTNTVMRGKERWPDRARAMLQATGLDANATLRLMGDLIAGELRQSIRDLTAPALSPVTLMLRKMRSEDPDLIVTGSTVAEARRRVDAGEVSGVTGTWAKPLVDTGNLLNSIDVEMDDHL